MLFIELAENHSSLRTVPNIHNALTEKKLDRVFVRLLWGRAAAQQVGYMALDLRSVWLGRGFKSSGQRCVTTLGSRSHLCASVTKQYNLVYHQPKGGDALRLGR